MGRYRVVAVPNPRGITDHAQALQKALDEADGELVKVIPLTDDSYYGSILIVDQQAKSS